MPRRKEAYLSVLFMLIILAAVMVSTLTDFAKFGIAQGQSNSTSSLSLTPEQKAAICDPNNPLSSLILLIQLNQRYVYSKNSKTAYVKYY
jgi:hypothetical protein